MKKVKLKDGQLAWRDGRGNAWLVEFFTEEQARFASATLYECYDCLDCVDCAGCIDCESCIRCVDCTDCFGSRYCIDCEDMFNVVGYIDNIIADDLEATQAELDALFERENPADFVEDLLKKHGAGLVRVGFCATEQDYRLVYPDETADYDTWRAHVYATLEELQARGIKAELYQINPDAYFKCLNGRENTKKARTLYITGLKAEDLDDE